MFIIQYFQMYVAFPMKVPLRYSEASGFLLALCVKCRKGSLFFNLNTNFLNRSVNIESRPNLKKIWKLAFVSVTKNNNKNKQTTTKKWVESHTAEKKKKNSNAHVKLEVLPHCTLRYFFPFFLFFSFWTSKNSFCVAFYCYSKICLYIYLQGYM